MKFGLKFREMYQKEANGAIAEEFDNLVAFLQMLWDKILDSEGNIQVNITDNSHGGAGSAPSYLTLSEMYSSLSTSISSISGGTVGGSGGGELVVYSRSFSGSEVTSLFTTPQLIIPAPGADKITVVMGAWFEVEITVGFGTNPSVTLFWDPTTSQTVLSFPSPTWTSTGKRAAKGVPVAQQPVYGSFDPRNKAVYLRTSSDPSGGTAVAGSVTVVAYIMPSAMS